MTRLASSGSRTRMDSTPACFVGLDVAAWEDRVADKDHVAYGCAESLPGRCRAA